MTLMSSRARPLSIASASASSWSQMSRASQRPALGLRAGRAEALVIGDHALVRDRDPARWRVRKQVYIDQIATKPREALLVSMADKLYNARSIINDMRIVGEEVWSRFSVPREQTLWYYKTVTEALRAAPASPGRLVRELGGIVAALERGVQRM